MKMIGIIKEIYGLDRIVIPKSLRDRYKLFKNVEIIAIEEGILIRVPEEEEYSEDK